MFIEDDLIQFLRTVYLTSKSCVYITNLDNVKCVCDKNFKKCDNVISKQLLRIILDMEISNCSESFIIINEKNKFIPIFEDNSLNINWNSEIIFPIWFDDHIHGTLIFTSFNKEVSKEHIKYAKRTQEFIIEYFIKQINKNYRKEESANE